MKKYKLNNASERRAKRKLNKNFLRFSKNLLATAVLIFITLFLYPHGLLEDINILYHSINKQVDFKLKNIEISGNDKISTDYIKEILQLQPGIDLLEIDLVKIEDVLKTEPWIKDFNIYRAFPETIVINIEEEAPYAIYIDEVGKKFMVNLSGKILEEANDNININEYLIISGKEANNKYNKLLDIVYEHNEVYDKLIGIEMINERRWNLKLENNVIIKLPERDIHKALNIFNNIFEKNIYKMSCVVDLRLIPDKIYVKISP